MKIIFMGTPAFAVASLEAVLGSDNQLIGVVCQPDRERNKKGEIVYPATKSWALANNVPIFQFEKARKEAPEILKSLAPDIIVTAAYGQILSQEILDIPRYGVINVHASLLPKYRGSSPVQHAIINGEKETGVTIMQTALGLDTGDIISVSKTQIDPAETANELLSRLSKIGAELLIKTLDDIKHGRATRTPQNEKNATKCPMIKKVDGLIDFSKSAQEVRNFIHGMNPWPLAFGYLGDKRISIYRAEIYTGMISLKLFLTGEVSTIGGNFLVACGGGGFLKILEAQVEGKRKMEGSELIKGLRLVPAQCFSNLTKDLE